jgi:hypothetical protein
MRRTMLMVSVLCFAFAGFAQQPAQKTGTREPDPERYKPHPGQNFVSQADIANPNLELKLYGGENTYLVTLDKTPEGAGIFLFSGLCTSSCAVALKDKNNYMDLSGLGRIRWRTRQSGFHVLRPVVKLADGTWLVGDHGDGYSTDWVVSEIPLYDLRWRRLDIEQVTEDKPDAVWVDKPDLSKVDEIGFTDLMKGSGHGGAGSSRVYWIEVYGNPVPRGASSGGSGPKDGAVPAGRGIDLKKTAPLLFREDWKNSIKDQHQ